MNVLNMQLCMISIPISNPKTNLLILNSDKQKHSSMLCNSRSNNQFIRHYVSKISIGQSLQACRISSFKKMSLLLFSNKTFLKLKWNSKMKFNKKTS